MPQTKIERKYFRLRVDERLQNLASIIDKKLAVAKFRSLNKILFVKLDTIPAGGKDAVLLGEGDA